MVVPRIGVGVPNVGPHASPEAVVRVARAAEELGFHSVSVSERLLLPMRDGWENTYGLPLFASYDTIETLTWVAAHTTRLRLATGVVMPLFQAPIVLARRIATLDVLSGGRVDLGIGLGWMEEELVAAGAPATGRGAAFEEHLAAVRACWGPDPVEHSGARYRIPPSLVGPKPVQSPLPVLVGGLARPAVERAARVGDGFVAALRDWDDIAQQIAWYRDAGGRGPVVLRVAGTTPADHPTSLPNVDDELARAERLGVDELVWDVNLAGLDPARAETGLDAERQVEAYAALAERLGGCGAGAP